MRLIAVGTRAWVRPDEVVGVTVMADERLVRVVCRDGREVWVGADTITKAQAEALRIVNEINVEIA